MAEDCSESRCTVDAARLKGPALAHVTDQLNVALADRYVIERELGAGGMATVYLARDVKHDRKVALKVLRSELAAVIGAERFLAEIKVTANLQHPHILPLHDSGEAGGLVFYVMPYIEGESLRDRLDRETQLPVEDAVRLTREIASALDYAHRQGVIHRDIKPENILLHEGQALVADFGIALAVSQAGGSRMTETGMSLGTPHYMSPEQAMGDRELNARSDVYALGATLYEMLVGEPPFTGPSAQAIVARVMTETPRGLRIQRHTVPEHVEAAVTRALEKLPADRFGTAAEFAQSLVDVRGPMAPRSTEGGTVRSAVPPFRRSAATLSLAAALLVTGGLAAWGWLRPPPPEPVSRFTVELPDYSYTFSADAPAISSDGSYMVYTGAEGGLLLRRRDQIVATPIPDASTGWAPFFSPDGANVAFYTGFPGALKVVPIAGGSPRTLVADSTYGNGGTWGADGWIYYIGGGAGALQIMRIRAEGGPPEPVASPDRSREELFFYWPDVLPGGKKLLVTVWRRKGDADIAVLDIATGGRTVLTRGIRALYVPTGHIIVVKGDGTLVGAPFDPDDGALRGQLTLLIDDIWVGSLGRSPIAVSRNGTLLHQGAAPRQQVIRVTRDGVVQSVDPSWIGRFGQLSLSPDGTRLAIAVEQDGKFELWVKTMPDGPFTRLAFNGTYSYRPDWTPDGNSVLFVSDQAGPTALYRIPADGSGESRAVIEDPRGVDEGTIAADGRWLIYRVGSGGGRDVVGRRVGVDSAPVPLAAGEFEEFSPTLSPDGRWLAYASDETRRTEVYVRPFPAASSARWQVSREGGSEPLWSRRGDELFYRNGAGDLVVVRVAPGATFRIESERALFSTREYLSDNRSRHYTVAPDDQSFYFVRAFDTGGANASLIIVLNWFEELKARVGQ